MPRILLLVYTLAILVSTHGPDFDINDMLKRQQNCPNYRCSAGYTPVPKSRPKFESTGCASMGGGVIMTGFGDESDAKKPYESCCHQWHACYQVCGVAKQTCDAAFETCAKQACGPKNDNVDDTNNEQCHKDIEMNNMLMKLSGCQKFNEAQLQACECRVKEQAPAQREAALRYFYKKQAPENVDKVANLVAKADSPSKLASLLLKLLAKYPAAIQKKKDPMQEMYDKIRVETQTHDKENGNVDVDVETVDETSEQEEQDRIEL